MGLNTAVVVHNDALHAIAEDPEFGKKLAEVIERSSFGDDRVSRSVSAVSESGGIHCNAAEVIETHHADNMVAILVGCNSGQEIGYAGHWQQRLDMSKAEDRIEALKTLALKDGYSLRRNPTKGKVK